MENVLILGNGYIGSELFSRVDKTKNNYFIFSREALDYSNRSVLRKFLLHNDIRYVVNCFGFTGTPNVDEAEIRKEECWHLNTVLPLQISRECKILDIQYIHVSSGCIYTGYEKEWTEEDKPNFGMFNESSFYSKSKHAFETMNEYGCTLRLRMPFSNSMCPRNYITKIYNYDNLIDYRNSKTYIPDLCRFIEHLINTKAIVSRIGTLNIVNPQALNTQQVVAKMERCNLKNENWKFVDITTLNMLAPRSNCVLSTAKLQTMFPQFHMQDEIDALDGALYNIMG